MQWPTICTTRSLRCWHTIPVNHQHAFIVQPSGHLDIGAHCVLCHCVIFFSRRKDIAIDRRVITKRDCLFPLKCSGHNSWKGNMKLASNKICILRNVFDRAFFGGAKMILLPLQLQPCYNRPAVIIYRQINLSNLSEPLTTIWFSANWIINVT